MADKPVGEERELYESTGIVRVVLVCLLAVPYSLLIDALVEPLIFRFVRVFLLFSYAYPIAALCGLFLAFWLAQLTFNRWLIIPRKVWLTSKALEYEVGDGFGHLRRYRVKFRAISDLSDFGLLAYLKAERSKALTEDVLLPEPIARPTRLLLIRDIVNYPQLMRGIHRNTHSARQM